MKINILKYHIFKPNKSKNVPLSRRIKLKEMMVSLLATVSWNEMFLCKGFIFVFHYYFHVVQFILVYSAFQSMEVSSVFSDPAPFSELKCGINTSIQYCLLRNMYHFEGEANIFANFIFNHCYFRAMGISCRCRECLSYRIPMAVLVDSN